MTEVGVICGVDATTGAILGSTGACALLGVTFGFDVVELEVVVDCCGAATDVAMACCRAGQ